MRVRCFEFRDDGLDADESAFKINEELAKLNISAEAIISIMQPTSCAITRVYYRV